MPELKRAGVKLTADGTAQYKADLKSATAALRQMAEDKWLKNQKGMLWH